MRPVARRTGLLALAAVLLTSPAVADPPPIPAGADGALWEVMESMQLGGSGNVIRTATATLVGEVNAGTPLCPVALGLPRCFVNVVARDTVRTDTGQGTISGDFWVVGPGDNPTDGAERVLILGTLRANIDLAPAYLGGIPLAYLTRGSVQGKGVGGQDNPVNGQVVRGTFTGTFRLPFPGRHGVPSYLIITPGGPIEEPVRENEKSLGVATVRLEIVFE